MAKFLDKNGLTQLWTNIKNTFALKSHTHDDRYYTENEVNTKLNGKVDEQYSLADNVDLNTITTSGFYRLQYNAQNMPSGLAANYGQLLVVHGGADTIAQMYFPYNKSSVYIRTGNAVDNSSGGWCSWIEVANKGDLTWNSIQNKPSSFTPASHTHSYNDLTNKPTIPSVYNPTVTITQGGVTKGSFTLNQSGAKTIALDGANVVELTRVWSGNSTTASFSVDYNSVYIVVFNYMTAIIKTAESGLGVIGYSNLISYIDSNSLIAGRGIYLAQIDAYTSKITSTFRLYSQMHSSSITNSTSSTGTYHYIKEVYKITM